MANVKRSNLICKIFHFELESEKRLNACVDRFPIIYFVRNMQQPVIIQPALCMGPFD